MTIFKLLLIINFFVICARGSDVLSFGFKNDSSLPIDYATIEVRTSPLNNVRSYEYFVYPSIPAKTNCSLVVPLTAKAISGVKCVSGSAFVEGNVVAIFERENLPFLTFSEAGEISYTIDTSLDPKVDKQIVLFPAAAVPSIHFAVGSEIQTWNGVDLGKSFSRIWNASGSIQIHEDASKNGRLGIEACVSGYRAGLFAAPFKELVYQPVGLRSFFYNYLGNNKFLIRKDGKIERSLPDEHRVGFMKGVEDGRLLLE